MSDTTTIDTVDSHHTDTHAPNTSHSWEAKVMELFDDDHDPVGDASAEVADAVADTIDSAKKTSAKSLKKTKKIKAPSKAMVAMKKWVDDMKASVTRPVKNLMSKVRSRTMWLVERLQSWGKLSTREILTVLIVFPGASLILGAHYANMFSKKAQLAIEKGKAKWESFLHSLWLWSDATTHDIAQAEEAHHPEVKPTITSVWQVGQVDAHHRIATNDVPTPHAHGNTEHPGQEKHAA